MKQKVRTIPSNDTSKPWWVIYFDGVEWWYDIGFDSKDYAVAYANVQYDKRIVIPNPTN